MANAINGSVHVVDTTGQIWSGPIRVQGIKLVGTSGTLTLTLKKGSSSGAVLYEMSTATTSSYDSDVEFHSQTGLYATITGTGAKAYIYTE